MGFAARVLTDKNVDTRTELELRVLMVAIDRPGRRDAEL